MPSETPTEQSSSASSSAVSISSASSRATSFVVAEMLANELLDTYHTHWNVTPLGCDIIEVFRRAGGRADLLTGAEKALYLAALGLAARSSSHPAIVGPLSPCLQFVDSPQGNAIDFSEFGAFRRGPCNTLARQAIAACSDPAVAASDLGLQAAMLSVYVFTAFDGDGSQEHLIPATATYRRTRNLVLAPEEQKQWNKTGIRLFMVDSARACCRGHRPSRPLFSDAEVSSLVPRPKHFGFELNLDCLDFIRNCTAAYPYEEYLQEEFNGNEETRLWNMRDIAALITTPSNLVQSRLPKLREVWAAATTARVRAQETRSLTWLLREETIAANLGPEALERADFLHGNMAPLIGQVCLAQFIVHTIVKGWVAEGSLGAEARDVWEECVRQTRRSIRFLAQSYQSFLILPRARSVAISQNFLRIEAVPDWVEIALERLPEEDKDDEVTMDELGTLGCGMRLAGWSYARAVIRLRELGKESSR